MPISLAASASCSFTFSMGTRRKLNCWQRDLMVAGTFCSSVVAKMKMTYGGGSSMVLSSALNALVESM